MIEILLQFNLLYIFNPQADKYTLHPYAKEYKKQFEGKTPKEKVKLTEDSLKKERGVNKKLQ